MKPKISIVYVIPELETGGTERIVFDLTRLLDRHYFDVSVCAFFGGSYEERLRKICVPVYLLNDEKSPLPRKRIAVKAITFMNRIKRLNTILRKVRADIIHSHHLGPLIHLLFTPARFGKHWIHTEHIRPDRENAGSPFLWFARVLYNQPTVLTGVSQAGVDYYVNTLSIHATKARLILNGINVTDFSQTFDTVKKRQELGIPLDAVVIGTLGNLRRQKNHANLITAFSLVHDRSPALRIVLAGGGECRAELESLTERLGVAGKVHFLGYRTDAEEIMAIFDIYCLPSFYEGMPLSIMEAWAAGKPVVATEVMGIQEIVTNGESGILVKSDDPIDLSEGLMRIIKDPLLAKKLTVKGMSLAQGEFSIDTMVKKYTDLYQSLI